MKPQNYIGKEVAGYLIVEHLGSGGMGEVFKGFHPDLERIAALKFLYQKEGAERFRNEAYIQSSISHPNIARLYEYTVVNGTPCIIMEFVEGNSLDVHLVRTGKLNNEETSAIVTQVANILAFLHRNGIVHRDIKPQNFKILKDKSIKMLDFGISKNRYTPKLTQLGFVVGTTEYMAPEQFRQDVNFKSDVWSLGVMTYEMLTGYMPFEATNAVSLRQKIMTGNYTSPRILSPDISPQLERLIERCLKGNLANRISAAQVGDLLNNAAISSLKSAVRFIDRKFRPFNLQPKTLLVMLLASFALIYLVATNGSPKSMVLNERHQDIQTANFNTITIDVPSVEDALLVFPDGFRKQVPYELTGKEGEKFQFSIEAAGYQTKIVDLTITSRRHSFEFSLEKKK